MKNTLVVCNRYPEQLHRGAYNLNLYNVHSIVSKMADYYFVLLIPSAAIVHGQVSLFDKSDLSSGRYGTKATDDVFHLALV